MVRKALQHADVAICERFTILDEALWILLQNKEWRLKLRDYIIEHKLTDDFWNGKMVAEGLGILAAVILAA